jgi:hypothetical protein
MENADSIDEHARYFTNLHYRCIATASDSMATAAEAIRVAVETAHNAARCNAPLSGLDELEQIAFQLAALRAQLLLPAAQDAQPPSPTSPYSLQ